MVLAESCARASVRESIPRRAERTLLARPCNGSFALPAKASGCTSEFCLATPLRMAAYASRPMAQHCFTTTRECEHRWTSAITRLQTPTANLHRNSNDQISRNLSLLLENGGWSFFGYLGLRIGLLKQR